MPTQDRPENLIAVARASRLLGVALLTGTFLTGCMGQEKASREDGVAQSPGAASELQMDPGAGNQDAQTSGGTSELVFSGLAVQGSEGYVPHEETSFSTRHDERLAVGASPSETSRLAYPEAPAPSLDDLRVRYLRTRPERIEFYRHEQRWRWRH